MRRLDLRTLVSMGRKAGLQTGELYGALSGRKPLPHEAGMNARDGNGYRVRIDPHGHHLYQQEPTGRDG